MNACMKMNGGGPFNLFPGQVTDDSELATCMMLGLIENEEDVKKNQIDMNKIANQYKNWMLSFPFDIGTTTIGGLRVLETMDIPT